MKEAINMKLFTIIVGIATIIGVFVARNVYKSKKCKSKSDNINQTINGNNNKQAGRDIK